MFFLAWRQLIARKKQTFLIVLGISFGTLLFVSISGLQLGMRKFITERLLITRLMFSSLEQND